MKLPAGSFIQQLSPHTDDRGTFTELYRESWLNPVRFPQWNMVRSEAGVLRGVHVHIKHYDYLAVAMGKVLFQLKDLRKGSPTEGLISKVVLEGPSTQALFIPPGVAHGFFFESEAIHIYAVSHYWNMEDELGCRFDDPELGMTWPISNPKLSERDTNANSLGTLLDKIPSFAQYQAGSND